MKVSRILFSCFFFAAGILLSYHTHAGHVSDLHPTHASCQICLFSDRTVPKVFQFYSNLLSAPAMVQQKIIFVSQSQFISQSYSFHLIRAPPHFS